VTFQEAMKLTSTVGTNSVYEDGALEMLWFAAASLPRLAQIVEIGCEYGRSTSLLMQIARARDFSDPHLVDPFLTYSGHPSVPFIRMMIKIGYPFHLHVMTTTRAYPCLPLFINLVHFDGAHHTEGLEADCELLLPRLVHGGYAVFHDYGRDSLYEVKQVVDAMTKRWRRVGLKETCLVVRKT